ncbi:MAG: hypothetical protein R2911_40300 [Caldilineaceae bacterium]
MMPVMVENGTMAASVRRVDAAQVEQLRAGVRALLLRQKDQIYAEIRAYPFPIPACDAQYNYLLEKRDLVSQELQQLDALTDAQTHPALALEGLKTVVAASNLLDRETRRRIMSA